MVSPYKQFWTEQVTPLHRRNDPSTYRAYGQELKNIFEYYGYSGGKVLEIGCSNGALFPYMGFQVAQYEGVDLSPSLLAIFREAYPSINVRETDGDNFVPKNKYELIFGNAVHQHFPPKMLKNHLDKVLPSLTENGQCVLANLPYGPLKRKFHIDEEFASGRKKPSGIAGRKCIKLVKYTLLNFYRKLSGKQDGIGYWYTPNEVLSYLGQEYKMEVLGSNFYPYRLHLVIRRS